MEPSILQPEPEGIYVEIVIDCSLDDLWAKTQTPELHQRWDLRFSDIQYIPSPNFLEPQQFLYSTRIGFGMMISGKGESVGIQEKDGSKTSALKFWSDNPKSLIREGSGYWKYIPTQDGVRFLTWYDYSTRFGLIGRAADAIVFRPLMSWVTAWSFDRLRLWIEKEIDPAISLRQSFIYGVSRLTVAFIWIYQGLIPKLLFVDRNERAMLADTGFLPDAILPTLVAIGFAEIAFGLLLIVAWRARSLFAITVLLMIVALMAVGIESPRYLGAAFNPVTLNIAVMSLAAIGFFCGKDLPSASRCRRKKNNQ